MLTLLEIGLVCAAIGGCVLVIGVKDGWLSLPWAGFRHLSAIKLPAFTRARSPMDGDGDPIYAVVLLLPQLDYTTDEEGYWARQNTTRAVIRQLARSKSVRLGRAAGELIELTFSAASISVAETLVESISRDVQRMILTLHPNSECAISSGFCRIFDERSFGSCFEIAKTAALEASDQKKSIVYRDSEEVHKKRQQRRKMMADLDQAIANGDIKVVYMPKRDVRSGTIACAEALARWDHKEWGTIRPDKFVELAEETGQIVDLTLEIMRQVLADQKRFEDNGLDLRVDVNLSAGLVNNKQFCTDIMTLVEGAESKFGFEITETAVIQGHDEAIATLDAFVEAGIWLSIDDYGSGLSSLSYLRQIPAHELKIDRMFIQNLTSTNRDPVLVRSTIDLAHSLGMLVTAEGVEDDLTYSLLRVMKCDLIQGYYVSPPLDISHFEIFMNNADTQIVSEKTQQKRQLK